MFTFSHLSVNGSVLVPHPFANEASMEGYIYDNPSVLSLNPGEEDPVSIKGLQVKWEGREKFGRLDLLATYRRNTVAIVELKRGDLTSDHFNQLKGYFDNFNYSDNIKTLDVEPINWVGILVGTGISEKFEEKIPSLKIRDDIPLGIIVLKRFKNDSQIMVVSDIVKGLPGYDLTKYSLDGEGVYPRGVVAFELVKKIVAKYPDKPVEDIIKIFSKHKACSGSGRTCLLNEYKQGDADYDDFRTKTREWLVTIKGVPYGFYSTFDKDQMKGVCKVAEEMGYKIEPV